ncbi:L,D-transpeptidase family protein [Vibrio sp. 404]|uniref:L,D-transpeptidase family protein n=1 Tax=Vibrio marinisediminis TaxID=2758441 RepID=A0A7W2FUC1_9VIBR|nr:L,D-transpeptidase family protein [Vibrio marinisediminis]MBA5764385.1 L,D-transpeptidase family protein [Vibrio marinisediminis]
MKLWISFLLLILAAPTQAQTEVDNVTVDKVTVDKSKRRLYLMDNNQVVREFRIALGKRPIGHKVYEGDQRTPEGVYKLDYVMEDSQFYRSIHISYPNETDMANAQRLNVHPGGDIKIHGQKNGEVKNSRYIQSFDWTDGCIALTNEEMDELLALVKRGTPIEILP